MAPEALISAPWEDARTADLADLRRTRRPDELRPGASTPSPSASTVRRRRDGQTRAKLRAAADRMCGGCFSFRGRARDAGNVRRYGVRPCWNGFGAGCCLSTGGCVGVGGAPAAALAV